MTNPIIFFTKIGAPKEKASVCLLLASLRAFGGVWSDCPFWIFAAAPEQVACDELTGLGARVLPLEMSPSLRYPFAGLVTACARAEALAPAGTPAVVWLDPNGLIVQPPALFDPGDSCDAALRPVHIRNVGLPPAEPLDAFWGGIYRAVGVEDVALRVTSFIGRQELRAYFNSHGLAVRPSLGLCARWLELFARLVRDETFQAAACGEERHRIFLFQALFSTLVAATLVPERIRILPESYNYPYDLHGQVEAARRPAAINDVVTLCSEDLLPHPDALAGIAVREPLRSWLAERLALE